MFAKEWRKSLEFDFAFEEYISIIKERNLEKWKFADNFFISLFQHLENWRLISFGIRCDVLMSRMRSGNVGLNPILYTMGVVNSPDCAEKQLHTIIQSKAYIIKN